MTADTRRLGKYEIIEELGKGGFATVYRARDPDLDREVALKVLDPLLTRDPVWVARFRREARAVARLDHPHVVTIYEVGEAHGMLYIVNRLIEGGNLAARIREEGPLPWDEVVRLTGEIASALDYAHGAGVVHRDLKAGNVLLDGERGAQLTDFGFASIVSESSFSVSISGGVVGTPQYIAPEVWEGQPATPQTDIYALGCILYEMVVGKHLFQGDTTPSVMRAHFQPVTLPEAWPERVPPGLGSVLEKALAKEPGERYARAGELAGAVAGLREDPLAAAYAWMEAAVAAGEWEQALELARAIQVEDAGYRNVVLLEETALNGLDRAIRAREAATWKAEAERALAEGDLHGAEMAARQWRTLLPDDPALRQFLHRVKRARAALGAKSLPKPQPQRAREPTGVTQVIPSPATRQAAWWLLGISIFLGLPAFGAGIIGIVGAVAMLKGRPWGRKAGLYSALLLEAGGLVPAGWAVFLLFVQPMDGGLEYPLLLCAAALFAMSAGVVLALLLSRETVVRGMGEEPRYLTGAWAMAVPAVITGVGIPVAVGLLRNRRWGRVAMTVFLVIFALVVIAGATLAGSTMRVQVRSYGSLEFHHNGWGMAIALVEAAVVALWCLTGVIYLNLARVRAWFEARDEGTAQGARA